MTWEQTHAKTTVMLRCVLFIVMALAFAAPAWGQSPDYDVRPQSQKLSTEQLATAFTGVTHQGAYNFDAEGNPGNRYTEWHADDGTILYREDSFVAKGGWTVIDGRICYRYDSVAISGGCFDVYQLGQCYYFYSARLTRNNARLPSGEEWGDYWTARSVPKGGRATCEDLIL